MKKAIGITLIFIGFFLLFVAISTIFDCFPKFLAIKNSRDAGEAIGYFVTSFLFIILSIWIIEKGFKKMRKPIKTIEEKINEL